MTLSISHLLNRTPTIKRTVQTADGQGGFTESLSVVATVKGRRRAASGSERLVAGREDAKVTHIWYFEPGTDIKVRDTVVDGSASYEVLALLPPSEDLYVKAQTKEIQIA